MSGTSWEVSGNEKNSIWEIVVFELKRKIPNFVLLLRLRPEGLQGRLWITLGSVLKSFWINFGNVFAVILELLFDENDVVLHGISSLESYFLFMYCFYVRMGNVADVVFCVQPYSSTSPPTNRVRWSTPTCAFGWIDTWTGWWTPTWTSSISYTSATTRTTTRRT